MKIKRENGRCLFFIVEDSDVALPPGRLIVSMGRPESKRKTTSRQISAKERQIRSLLKEERCSYLTCNFSNS